MVKVNPLASAKRISPVTQEAYMKRDLHRRSPKRLGIYIPPKAGKIRGFFKHGLTPSFWNDGITV
jgi:hypothetical protein